MKTMMNLAIVRVTVSMARLAPGGQPRNRLLPGDPINIQLWYTLQDAIDDAYVAGFSAVCRDDPDQFYSDGHVPVREGADSHYATKAKAMCNQCVLRDPCVTYALVANEDDGVWGGYSPADRKDIRKGIVNAGDLATVAEIGYFGYERSRIKARRGASQYVSRANEVSDS